MNFDTFWVIWLKCGTTSLLKFITRGLRLTLNIKIASNGMLHFWNLICIYQKLNWERAMAAIYTRLSHEKS